MQTDHTKDPISNPRAGALTHRRKRQSYATQLIRTRWETLVMKRKLVLLTLLLAGLSFIFYKMGREPGPPSPSNAAASLSTATGGNGVRGIQDPAISGAAGPSAKSAPIPVLEFRARAHAELVAEAEARGGKGEAAGIRFAEALRTSVSPGQDGVWDEVAPGRSRWRLTIASPGALSLNFGFSTFVMPEGGSLTILGPDGTPTYRSFTHRDNEVHGQLWTPVSPGEEATLVVDVPTSSRSELELVLGQVSHGFLGFKDIADKIGGDTSGSCNIDVVCSAAEAGTPWITWFRDQIESVGAYTVLGLDFCSGALVNNTAYDGRPLFLTANHCRDGALDVAADQGRPAGDIFPSIVAYWNFENSVCRPPGSSGSGGVGDGGLTQFTTGAGELSFASPTDFWLLEFDDPIDPRYRVFFAGWDRTDTAPVGAVGIHHPQVAEKRISFSASATTVVDGDETGNLGIFDKLSATHLKVPEWDLGTTERGSSGSPLFNLDGRIVGQLHGGTASCFSPDEPDFYGRIHRSWYYQSGEFDESPGNKLAPHLDPLNQNPQVLDGIEHSDLIDLVYVQMSVDGNGQIEPDEIVNLRCLLRNRGDHVTATNVSAVLSEVDPAVAQSWQTFGTFHFDSIPPGASVWSTNTIQIDTTGAEGGQGANLFLGVTSDQGDFGNERPYLYIAPPLEMTVTYPIAETILYKGREEIFRYTLSALSLSAESMTVKLYKDGEFLEQIGFYDQLIFNTFTPVSIPLHLEDGYYQLRFESLSYDAFSDPFLVTDLPVAASLPYSQAFEFGLPIESADSWEYYTENSTNMRVAHQSGALRLKVADGLYANSWSAEATLYVNLLGQDQFTLRFDHRTNDFSDNLIPASFTGHADGDGVAISDDGGASWQALRQLDDSAGTDVWETIEIDLDAALASLGLNKTADVRIRFQTTVSSFSRYRDFDNIEVFAEPELVVEHPTGTPLVSGSGSVDWPETPLGAALVEKEFVIRNTGTGQLSIDSVTAEGANASDFVIDTNDTTVFLSEGESTSFLVRFVPGGAGNRSAILRLASNDPDDSPFEIPVTGIGISESQIAVEQPVGFPLEDGNATIDFGEVPFGADGVMRTVTVRCQGSVALAGLSAGVTGLNTGDFSVDASGLPFSLNAGETGELVVTFTPGAYGTRKAELLIGSSDPDESPFNVVICGEGVNEPPSEILLSATEVAENMPGIVVGQLSAVDPNPLETHTFSLAAGEGDSHNGLFVVDGSEVRLAGAADFEADPVLSVRVRAIDSGIPSRFREEILEVNVTDDVTEDFDMDDLTQEEEATLGTSDLIADFDEDGVNDGAEVNIHQTDPLLADTDGDGLEDGLELNTHFTNPLAIDTDGDGLRDRAELEEHSTNPRVADTDGDGDDDGVELAAGTSPSSAVDRLTALRLQSEFENEIDPTEPPGSVAFFSGVVEPAGDAETPSFDQGGTQVYLVQGSIGAPTASPVAQRLLYTDPLHDWGRFAEVDVSSPLALHADIDNDGFNALLEWIYNLDPHLADAKPLGPGRGGPVANLSDTGGGPFLTYTFDRRIAHGLTDTICVSSNLGSWDTSEDDIIRLGEPVPNGDGTVRVTVQYRHPVSGISEPVFIKTQFDYSPDD
jgi:hypothetical protein